MKSEGRQIDLLLGHRNAGGHGRQQSGQQAHAIDAGADRGIVPGQQSEIGFHAAGDGVVERQIQWRRSRLAGGRTAVKLR